MKMNEQEVVELERRIMACWNGEMDRDAIELAISALDSGALRVASPPENHADDWTVHGWLKMAILLYFRVAEMRVHELGAYQFHDKIPLKQDLAAQGVRLVPPGHIRRGAHVERGCVVMRLTEAVFL